MTSRRASEIFCCHVQVNLSTRDLAVPEEVSDGHETDAGAHQVGGEGMAKSVRAQRVGYTLGL